MKVGSVKCFFVCFIEFFVFYKQPMAFHLGGIPLGYPPRRKATNAQMSERK